MLTGRSSRIAIASLIVAAVALWLLPPLGMVLATGLGVVLAPWGRRLGERVILSVLAASALVAALFVTMTATGWTLPPLGWRALITVLLLAEIAALFTRRGAPVWPVVRSDDAVGLVAGTAFLLIYYGVYAFADTEHTLNGLLAWWAHGEVPHDHSSHLPMFHQVMAAQSWDFSALSPDLLFTVYPMLHVSLWSVGEWAAGVDPLTPGLDLVRPYVAWTALTAALAAAILTWSAGLAARAFAGKRDDRSVVALAAVLAASATGLWCLLGSMGSMVDFAAGGYLAAAALAIGAVTVSVRSRAALRRIGWFTLPLAGLSVAYIYPTLAAGLVLPGVVVVLALARWRRRMVIAFIALTVVCGALAWPALRAVTDSTTPGPWGTLTGGLPAFEYWPAVVMTAIVLITMTLRWRVPGRLVSIGMVGPLLAAAGMALMFGVESVRSGLEFGNSYYTNKMVYSLLLAVVPLASALAAGWAAQRMPAADSQRRTLAIVMAGVVALIAVAEVSTLTIRPGVGGGKLSLPSGIVALQARSDAITRDPVGGDVVVATVNAPTVDGFTTVTWIPVDRSVTGIRGEYVNLFAGRTAHGLRNFATMGFERYNMTVDTILRTKDPVASLQFVMRSAPELKLTLVVPDQATADTLAPAVNEFGADRLRVIVASGG
ncbi:MAG: hypothetical protein WCP26_11725 [Actinomycetes bacterium]